MLAFFGPGYLVAVGYMDPGNWATSLAGGSRYGYSLLCVILISSVVAMLFQAAAVRLGIATGMDLAQACRRHFPRRINLALWALCEMAIAACNVAEILGMAIGLNLLFGMPLLVGTAVTVLDVMLILTLQSRGFRYIEAVIIALIGVVAACFAAQMVWLRPSMADIVAGFLPHAEIISNPSILYLAVGIVGATIMPHNLYLHSSIVQQRLHADTQEDKRASIRFATIDSTMALAVALLINASIMIVAAAAFHRSGVGPVTGLEEAYRLLSPLLGIGMASTLFGVALLASGLSSSVTGTLAGQIVMLGFLDLRLSPALRALATRLLAVVPAVIAINWYGNAGVNELLIFSQVILSMQLPFAIVPLLMFTTRGKTIGRFVFGRGMGILLWFAAIILVAMNLWLIHRWASG